jgi:hypothetical protein
MTVKSTTFWDVSLCDSLEVHLRFEGTHILPKSSELRVNQAQKPEEAGHTSSSSETLVDFHWIT